MRLKTLTPRLLMTVLLFGGAAKAAEQMPHGEYVLHLAGCVHCHTAEDGEDLAGGRALHTPFGTFYTPNITPHPQAGIGEWTEDQFRRALHEGVAPDGSDYFPAFPFTSYTRMSNEDVSALYQWMKTLPASAQPSREHDLPWYLRWRFGAKVWKWLFFDEGRLGTAAGQSPARQRGAYIAESLGHCGECHTPRNLLGVLRRDFHLAGNPQGPDGEKVPNITPDPQTGIGDWSAGDLGNFLEYGELPDGEYIAGSMEPVSAGMSKLTSEDRAALVEYLRGIVPMIHAIE